MATNQVYEHGDQFQIVASAVDEPATPTSGDPVLIGALPAVALTDVYEDLDGVEKITIKTNGVYDLAVEAEGGAIAIGDIVYYDAGDEGLNGASSGNTRYGYALGAIDSGATAVIPVKIGY